MKRVQRRLHVFVLAGLAVLTAWPQASRAQLAEYGQPYTASGGFFAPTGLGIDEPHGLVFVADTGHQRLKYTAIASIPGTPAWSELGYFPDPSAAVALDGVQGVAVDAAGNVYAVDTFSGEVQLYRYDAASGAYAYDDAFASATRHTVADRPITFPRDIAVGAGGRVYLLDSGNNRILVASGPTATVWSVWHADASWLNPYGLDVARDGTVYVADTGNSRIVKIAPDGTSTVIGGYGTAGGQFRGPRDVAVGEDGRLFVADTLNHRVSVLNRDGHFAGDLATAPLLASPQKVNVDREYRVFILDSDMARVVAFLGATVPKSFDLYVRDNATDAGAEPSAGMMASPDIVIRRSADIDPARATGLDGYASEQPIVGLDAYVYVAVHNTGPAAAHDASVDLYWAFHGGPLNYPEDWRGDAIDVFAGGVRVSGHRLPVPEVPAGGVRVVGPFVWSSPPATTNSFDVIARVVHPFDSVATGGTGREAAVRASNNVAMRSTVLTEELPDGDFVSDMSGDLYVEILYSKAAYANYFVLTDPASAAPATCSGLSVASCYFETNQCRTKCRQDSADISCACLVNEMKSVAHVERGQRIASQLHSDRGRDGSIDFVFSSKPGLNADGFDHLRTYKIFPGAWVLEWEDGWGGGDRDFNDMVVLVRVISPDASNQATQLTASQLSLVTNVVLEDPATTSDPKVRVTALLQNDADAPERAALCARLPLREFSNGSVGPVYFRYVPDKPGAPQHYYEPPLPTSINHGVSLSREMRWSWLYQYDPPIQGDVVTVPARTAAGPGQVAIEYEVSYADIDRSLRESNYKLIDFTDRDAIRRTIASRGISAWLLRDIAPDNLVCPSGVFDVFAGRADGVATPSLTITHPFTYNIASPAYVTVPVVTPQMETSGATVRAVLEFFWTDNLPVHLKGHIASAQPQRVPFIAWPSMVREVPVTLQFPDDIPETFRGRLETILRNADSGAVLMTSTHLFTKDHAPPVFAPVHTERGPDRIYVTATGEGGPSGLTQVALDPTVNGAQVSAVYMRHVSGDFHGPTALEATIAPIAERDQVALDLDAADGAGNTAIRRIPVASTGGDLHLECSSIGGSWFDLDGTRSTAAADAPVTYAWKGPFGTAEGVSPLVFFPLGSNAFALSLADGRGYTGRQASTAVVVDTTPPALTVEASPTCLWPPSHKFVALRLGDNLRAQVQDVCDPSPSVRIVRVESNEPLNGIGDGNTTPDAIFGDTGACLRAERGGGGGGRVYRVVLQARDASGNVREAVVHVRVPQDGSLDASCPALPPDTFVEATDTRCDFTAAGAGASVAPSGATPADATVSSRNAMTAAETAKAAGASCATSPFTPGVETALVVLPLLYAWPRRRRVSGAEGESKC
jgi:DNA-binding beta-propeller fold protein YncE